MLRGGVLLLPGVKKVDWGGGWKPEPEQPGNYAAPLGPVTPKGSEHVLKYVLSHMSGGEIADGTIIERSTLDELFFEGYEDFRKSRG